MPGERTTTTTSTRTMRGGYTQQEVRTALWHIIVAAVFASIFFSIAGNAPFVSLLKKYLHADDFRYGLVTAAGPVGVIFQLLGSLVVERTGRVKRNFLIFVTTHRLVWLGAAAIPLFVGHTSTTTLVGWAGLIAFGSAALGNFGGSGWAAWMSRIIPKSVAGKFFGLRASIALLVMAVAGYAAGWLIDYGHGAGWTYTVIFSVAAVAGAIDILLFIPVREVPMPPPREKAAPGLREILLLPWRDLVFRRYAYYIAAAWIAYMMMGPFVMPYCFDLGFSVSTSILILNVIPLLAMALTAPFWGRAIDRFGPKPVLAASTIAQMILPIGWIVMHQELLWVVPILTILGGLTWPGIDQVFFYMQLKGFPDERRTAYIASINVVFGLACTIGPLLGGWYANWLKAHMTLMPYLPAWASHYQVVFLTAVILRILAYLIFFIPIPLTNAGTSAQVAGFIARETRLATGHLLMRGLDYLARETRELFRALARARRLNRP